MGVRPCQTPVFPQPARQPSPPKYSIGALGALSLVARGVVSLEQVKTEIVFVIPPHRMNVISLILRAVHLDQKGGRLDTIIVQAASLNVSSPSEKGRLFRLLSRQFHSPVRHGLR